MLLAPLFLGFFVGVQSTQVQTLADTEKAFANMAAEKGTREAFLYYFRDDAISFGPQGMQNAKKAILSRPPLREAATTKLVWEPFVVDVCASNDLGYTFGPSYVASKKDGSAIKDSSGIYLSVWKKTKDQPWRVALDIGITAPMMPSGLEDVQQAILPGPLDNGEAKSPIELEGTLTKTHHSDMHLSRLTYDIFDLFPTQSLMDPKVRTWVASSIAMQGNGMSNDKTFVYTYGTYKNKTEHGSYVHIWRRTSPDAGWFLLVQVQKPDRGKHG